MLPTPMLLLALAAASPAPSAPRPNPRLPAVAQQMDDLDYGEAERTLDLAWADPFNDRASTLRILELRAVVAATLEETEKARTCFRMLATLDPAYPLSPGYAPNVVKAFADALRWAESKPLTLRAEPPEPGHVGRDLPLTVVNDAFKLGARLRFHLRVDGGKWLVRELPLDGPTATALIDYADLDYWAELLNERGSVLVQLGSEGAPLHAQGDPKLRRRGDAPVAAQLAPKPLAPAPALSPMAIGGWGLIGVAVAAAAGGSWFGLQSMDARRQVESAQIDPLTGATVGLTQRQAFALDAQAKSTALIANLLLGGAIAAAGGGGTLLFLANGSHDSVGVAVEGRLP